MRTQVGLTKQGQDKFELVLFNGMVLLSVMNREEFAHFVDWCNRALRPLEMEENAFYRLKAYDIPGENPDAEITFAIWPGRPKPLE